MNRVSTKRWLLASSVLFALAGVPGIASIPNPGTGVTDPDPDPTSANAVFGTYTRNYDRSQYQKPSLVNTPVANVVFPVQTLQPSVTGEVVGFNFSGPPDVALPARLMKFGHVFGPGDVKVTDNLEAFWGGTTHPVQMHVLSRQPDDITSVHHALLITQAPALTAGQVVQAMLRKASAAPTGSAVVVNPSTTGITSTLTYVNRRGPAREVWNPVLEITETFDDGVIQPVNTTHDLSPTAIVAASFKSDIRYSGPLATEKRYIVDLGLAVRVTMDITQYNDGKQDVELELMCDVMNRPGIEQWGTYTFNWVTTLNGATIMNEQNMRTPSRMGYGKLIQNCYTSALVAPYDLREHAIQFDAAYMSWIGMVPPYNLNFGVNESRIVEMFRDDDNFRGPMSTNGVASPGMGGTGDRADIGTMTEWQAIWLKTMDYRMRSWVLGHAEAWRAMQVNYIDSSRNWVPLNNSPEYGSPVVWTMRDNIGIEYVGPQEKAIGLKRDYDVAHAPIVGYLPYLITARRMYGDIVEKEGAVTITDTYMDPRKRPVNGFNLDWCIAQANQVREAGWATYHVALAQIALPDSSVLKRHFLRTINYTFAYLNSQVPAWKAAQGEPYGWLLGANAYDQDYVKTWQQYHWTLGCWASWLCGSGQAKTHVNTFLWNHIAVMGALPEAQMPINVKAAYAINVGNSHNYNDPNKPLTANTFAKWKSDTTAAADGSMDGSNTSQILYRAQNIMVMMLDGSQRDIAKQAVAVTKSNESKPAMFIDAIKARGEVKEHLKYLTEV